MSIGYMTGREYPHAEPIAFFFFFFSPPVENNFSPFLHQNLGLADRGKTSLVQIDYSQFNNCSQVLPV